MSNKIFLPRRIQKREQALEELRKKFREKFLKHKTNPPIEKTIIIEDYGLGEDVIKFNISDEKIIDRLIDADIDADNITITTYSVTINLQ